MPASFDKPIRPEPLPRRGFWTQPRPGLLRTIPVGIAAMALLSAVFAGGAHATVTSGTSSGYGEDISLTLTPALGSVVNITSGPLPIISGTAPAPYSLTNSAVSASVSGILSTGILNVAASSGVTGLSGTVSTQGSSIVNNLNLAILNVLGITSGTIQTTSTVTGDVGTLTPAGTTTIANLSVAGLAPFGANITPVANDVILNLLGIEVTLNRQVVTDTAALASIKTDGIAVDFTNVAAIINGTAGLLNGEITIATSTASERLAVMEPTTIAELSTGLVSLILLRVGYWARDRRRARVRVLRVRGGHQVTTIIHL
jgi:hypothetical protein